MKLARIRSAFILLEAMLAVAIFAIGIIALGKCVENCVRAEVMKEEDGRVRRILDNRMTEIESGATPLVDSQTEDLKGMGEGMKLKTTREPLERKNQDDRELLGLYRVKLELTWDSSGSGQSRTLEFYVLPRQN